MICMKTGNEIFEILETESESEAHLWVFIDADFTSQDIVTIAVTIVYMEPSMMASNQVLSSFFTSCS